MRIIPFLTKVFIAPHGITDIGHSIITNNSVNLLKIYGINFTLTNIFNQYSFDILNLYFVLSTLIHFRHDMPTLFFDNIQVPRYLLISCLLLLFYNFRNTNQDFILYYMIFIHVPNHLKLNYFHISKLKSMNFILYLLFGLISLNIDLNFILYNHIILNYIKSIIISHVLYQELYVLH